MGGEQQDDLGPEKKIRATTREPNGAMFMLRCAHFALSDEALSNMTMGMVTDMLIEEANDREQYPYEATQDDIRAFFGG